MSGVVVTAAAQPNHSLAAAEAPEPGAKTHDGFYLRIATGLGAYDEQANSERDERYRGVLRANARGFAVATEFAMGGTPYPGLVVGGGVYGTEAYTSTVTVSKSSLEVPEDLSLESRNLALLGPFVDRYFVPNLGVHVQGALGLATLSGVSVNRGDFEQGGYQAAGPGLMLGFGVEMWIASQWSLGVMVRFSSAVLFGKDSYGVRWVHYATSWPSFLMTVTYH